MAQIDATEFDRVQGWGVPAPRVEAADGLTRIATQEGVVGGEVLRAIECLAVDGAPEVRFCVARGLQFLRTSSPELMWRIADQMIACEASTAVLSALVSGLPAMAGPEANDRLQAVVETVYDRFRLAHQNADELLRHCVEVAAGIYVWRGSDNSDQFIREVVLAELPFGPGSTDALSRGLRDSLVHGDLPGSAKDATIRARAMQLAKQTIEAATSALSQVDAELRESNDSGSEDDLRMRHARAVYQLLDGISSEVYFASGAYDLNHKPGYVVSEERRRRFYSEVGPILDLLGAVPIPQVSHHVLEVLEFCLPVDPRGVFLRIHRTLIAAQKGAYEFDSLAEQLVVKLIQRFLTEHGVMLQGDGECIVALVAILDIFVSVGWYSALQMTYDLNAIFR
jgi:hypothetical protein